MVRVLTIVFVGLFFFAAPAAAAEPSATEGELTFEKDVRPILRAHCFDCHGAADDMEGALDLRLRRLMLKGGESGAAIVPENPEESLLITRIRAGEMPPSDAKMSAVELALLERWIAGGAKTARPEPEKLGKGLGITLEERAFWSFQPIQRPAIPAFAKEARVRTPIDALLLVEMRKKNVSFSADADRLTLLRRVSLDLLGLPPTPEQVDAFLADTSEGAYERLVDALLKSPHYGERWGRHWLDVAGYADSEGQTTADAVRSYAYKYRDYVIRSFNADKPFDRFIQEQIAGDEMTPPPHKNLTPDQIEQLAATGFLRMAADGTGSGANNVEARNKVVSDTLKIISTSLLGLSVGCAQCHDHRYDPIPQTDYYALRAIFEPALNPKQWLPPSQRLISLYTDADRQKAAEVEAEAAKVLAERAKKQAELMKAALEKELAAFPEPLRGKLLAAYKTPGNKRTPEQQQLLKKNPSVNITTGNLYQYDDKSREALKKFNTLAAKIRAKKPREDFVRSLEEPAGKTPLTHLFHRGDYRQPKESIEPAGLTITAQPNERYSISANNADLPTTGRRTAFAKWLTNGRHPLVARVLVNRFWMHHFGRALVETPSEFGRLGQKPTHPLLLDYLAADFIANGWSLKHLHRQIMMSTVYRQSSVRTEKAASQDPANRLYWKKPLQRLDAEILRDRILAVSGRLSDKMFGPPAPIKADDTGQIIVSDNKGRRSVYVQVRRTQPVAMLTAFDAPVMVTNCQRRPSSTVATQALMLMNSDFILAEAARFAQRVNQEASAEHAPAFAKKRSAAAELRLLLWQAGYGAYDAESGRTGSFQPLPYWTGSAWRGGAKLPASQIGWVLLNAAGGHTGNDQQHAAIRRWTAPVSGVFAISGKFAHRSKNGDGVRGRMVSSRSGLAGEWTVHHGGTATAVALLALQAGDTLDFITDCRGTVVSDSFHWSVDVKRIGNFEPSDAAASKTAVASGTLWNSATGFQGPPPPALAWRIAYAWKLAYARVITPDELAFATEFVLRQTEYLKTHPAPNKIGAEQQALTNLCQTLLSSNEFLYVD